MVRLRHVRPWTGSHLSFHRVPYPQRRYGQRVEYKHYVLDGRCDADSTDLFNSHVFAVDTVGLLMPL